MKFLVLVFYLFPFSALAEELVETNLSVRALGMGNAYTPIVADADALAYNPAGLCQVGGFNWTIMDPQLGINGLDAYQRVQEVQGAAGLDAFSKFYGVNIYSNTTMKTALTFPCLGFGGYGGGFVGVNLVNPAFPNLNVSYIADYGVAAGAGLNFGLFSIGMVGKRITRIGATAPVGLSTFSLGDSSEITKTLQNQGTGFAADLGMLLTIPAPFSPRFSFVWKNLGQTVFKSDTGGTAPPRIRDEMIFGFAMEMDFVVMSLTPVFDYKYLNRTDVQLGRRVHLGVELGFPIFDIRAGFSEGYYTLGAGMDLWLMRLDVATYGVELGEYPGQHEDRRIVAQITFELGFDPSSFAFLGGGSGGKGRRRLKQRR